MNSQIIIRGVEPEDASALLGIYAPYVENTAITFEYEIPTLEEFTERVRSISAKFPYLVAERNGELLGYAYANTFKARAAYNWSVEVTIYIRQGYKRSGIGKSLYEALEKELKQIHILNLNACIAYTEVEDEKLSHDSVRFHEKMGYEWVGRFHKCGYKSGTWYDMIWMEKHIGEHEEIPMPVKAWQKNEVV